MKIYAKSKYVLNAYLSPIFSNIKTAGVNTGIVIEHRYYLVLSDSMLKVSSLSTLRTV